MKTILILLLTIPLVSFAPKTDADQFVGKWSGEDKGKFGSLLFEKEGYATFEMEGKKMGGREFIVGGKKTKMTYSVNSNTEPIQIDFIMTSLENKEVLKRLLGIAKFKDNNTMKLAMAFGQKEKRPTTFNSENSMVLRRDK